MGNPAKGPDQMWYAGYSQKNFDNAIKMSKADGRVLYAFALFRDVDSQFSSFLVNHYADLNRDSGNAIQIIAPVRPPGSPANYPAVPTASGGERDHFFGLMSELGVPLDKMPGFVLFERVERLDSEKLSSLGFLSLQHIERSPDPAARYREFYSTFFSLADKVFHDPLSPKTFAEMLRKQVRLTQYTYKLADFLKKFGIQLKIGA